MATVEHGADIYHEDDKVLPTCQCGWEGIWLPTFDEAADAYALHRMERLGNALLKLKQAVDDGKVGTAMGPAMAVAETALDAFGRETHE